MYYFLKLGRGETGITVAQADSEIVLTLWTGPRCGEVLAHTVAKQWRTLSAVSSMVPNRAESSVDASLVGEFGQKVGHQHLATLFERKSLKERTTLALCRYQGALVALSSNLSHRPLNLQVLSFIVVFLRCYFLFFALFD